MLKGVSATCIKASRKGRAIWLGVQKMVLVQQLINGLMLGSIYISVAVAFTLTIGILNFLNFTIPALYMLAGMVG